MLTIRLHPSVRDTRYPPLDRWEDSRLLVSCAPSSGEEGTTHAGPWEAGLVVPGEGGAPGQQDVVMGLSG